MAVLTLLTIGILRFPLVTWFILTSGRTQIDAQRVPRFEDYPVREIFKGTPAIPKLRTPLEQTYADEIKAGVKYGYVVVRDGKEERGPNFAGDQIVIHWGCGAPCMRMAMVDARSGEVHLPPISYPGHGVPSFDLFLLYRKNYDPQNPESQFRQNSNLMIIKCTPSMFGPDSYTYYFLWRQNRWILLQKVPLAHP